MASRLSAVAFAQVDGVLVARTMGGAAVGAYRCRLGIQVAAGGAIYGGIPLTVYRQRIQRYLRFFRQLRRGRPLPPEAAASGGP